jgi:hypothetical protein
VVDVDSTVTQVERVLLTGLDLEPNVTDSAIIEFGNNDFAVLIVQATSPKHFKIGGNPI